jgi:hypothetical protein
MVDRRRLVLLDDDAGDRLVVVAVAGTGAARVLLWPI